LERLHEERLAALRDEAERRAKLHRTGHGTYEEVAEGDFLEVVTKTPLVVAHFFHRDFERCRIMDRHLSALAVKHFETRFIKISATDAPFFVDKLKIRTLPCIVCFIDGVALDRVVGFADFGGKDDFQTDALERRLMQSEALKEATKAHRDEDESGEDRKQRSVRHGFARLQQTTSDEDSDFD
jgi:thioredoxin-like negative regulator of GroEL